MTKTQEHKKVREAARGLHAYTRQSLSLKYILPILTYHSNPYCGKKIFPQSEVPFGVPKQRVEAHLHLQCIIICVNNCVNMLGYIYNIIY